MKNIKFIQINTYKGKYLEQLARFLKEEDPDIVTMQEVSSYQANYYADKNVDTFEYLRNQTGLNAIFDPMMVFVDSPHAFVGNAVFSKFPIKSSKQIVLKNFDGLKLEMFEQRQYFPELPRTMVDAVCEINGKAVHVLSAHGGWSAPPQDTPETLRQSQIIAGYLQNLKEPYVLGADMNMPPDKEVIRKISRVSNNLMDGSGIQYTTHPTMHKIAPIKLMIDYIFTSHHFKKVSLDTPRILVSDHLPVIAQLKFLV